MIVLAYFSLALTALLLWKALFGTLGVALLGALMLVLFVFWLALGEEAGER